MINIENTAESIKLVEESGRDDIVHLVLNKELNIEALSMEKLDTGIIIYSDKAYDICVFNGNVTPESESEKIIIHSHIMEQITEKTELVLDIQNVIINDITIPVGTELGYIMNVYSANNILDIDASSGINIYKDDKIVVKSLDNNIHNIETIIDNDKQKLQIEL